MKNKRIVQSAKRPQAYVPDNRIATGQDKAKAKARTMDMRGWWRYALIQNGWTDSLSAFSLPMKGPMTRAFINHGRWMAYCPDPDCLGCEVVDPGDPVFICLSCGNIANEHDGNIRFYPVKFPEQLVEAEEILLKRDVVRRNWKPDEETLDDLVKENKKHGISA